MIALVILVNAILINNFVLSRFLGVCPFLGVSKKIETAVGMGMAVTFVMGLASIITFAVNELLAALGITYLQTIVFILVIASLVQIVEAVIKKVSPALYAALGVYLPLITTNCAVLGVAIMNVTQLSSPSIFAAFLNGVGSGIGFTLAIVLLAGIRERLSAKDIPEAWRGFPITLIIASLMAMAFAGFSGLVF